MFGRIYQVVRCNIVDHYLKRHEWNVVFFVKQVEYLS
jgi:hypothetical protein